MKPSTVLLAHVRAVAAENVLEGDDARRGVCARLALEAATLSASGRAQLGQAFIDGLMDALLPVTGPDAEEF